MRDLIGSRRVLFVSGKGGVGKTSVAAAIALRRARTGGRVLTVSTDPAHSLGHVWDARLGDTPQQVVAIGGGRVDALEIDPQATVDRHLDGVRAAMRRLLPERLLPAAERHLDLARHAPGTHESAVLERVAEAVELGLAEYDLVVFDTAPSGHTARLMALPGELTAWTESLLANRDRSERFGAALRGLGGGAESVDRDAELRRLLVRRRQRFAGLRDTLLDHGATSFVLVVTAERLPVLETVELYAELRRLAIGVGALVINRRSPEGAGELLAARREQEAQHVATLAERLPGVPRHELPLLRGDLAGAAELEPLEQSLAAGE